MVWTEQKTYACRQLTEVLVSNKAVESNPAGLKANADLVRSLFEQKGCSVRTVENPDAPYRPILIAEIGDDGTRPTVGFFGHYDVEEAEHQRGPLILGS